MKRIKPGRGPSAMGAAMSVIIAVFGVFWTVAAASMGAPVFFVMFGVIFIIAALVQAVYNFKNATGKKRFSVMDIVEDHEEGDPTDRWVQDKYSEEDRYDYHEEEEEERDFHRASAGDDLPEGEINFCPYCGSRADKKFRFCQKCGKRIR